VFADSTLDLTGDDVYPSNTNVVSCDNPLSQKTKTKKNAFAFRTKKETDVALLPFASCRCEHHTCKCVHGRNDSMPKAGHAVTCVAVGFQAGARGANVPWYSLAVFDHTNVPFQFGTGRSN